MPSIYFIGKSGMPLDIVVDVHEPVKLVEKLAQMLEKHGVSVLQLKSNIIYNFFM